MTDQTPSTHHLQQRILDLEQQIAGLRRTQSWHSVVIDSLTVGVCLLNAAGCIIAANPRMASMLGYDTLPSNNCHDLAYPNDGFVEDKPIAEIFQGKRRYHQFEMRLLHRDGTPLWVRATAQPILAADQTVQYVVGTFEDISQHKQIETEARQTQEQQQAFTQLIFEYVYGATLHQDGTSTTNWHSGAIEEVTTYTSEEILAAEGGWSSFIYPPDIQALAQVDTSYLAQQQTAAVEYRIITRDGGLRWVRDRVVPIGKDENGDFQVIGAVESIDEQKRAVEALARSEELHRTIMHNFPGGMIALFDHDLRYTLVDGNGLAEIGLTPDDLQGQRLRDVFPPEVYERDEAHLLAALAGEARINDVAYADKHYRIHTLPVKDRQGEIMAGMVMTQDITPLRMAEQQRIDLTVAQEKARFLAEFLGNMSHDLKTPLSIINTSLYLLERYSDPVQQQRKLDNIKSQVKHLERMIQDILTISRLEYLPETTLMPLNLGEVFNAAIQRIRPYAEDKGLHFRWHIPDRLPSIMADSTELDRAFVNLLQNAVEYTPSGGRIDLDISVQADHVQVRVADTGIGIEPADLPYIFDRFYRADKARNTHTGGSGLGLAIANRIIEIHGGTITVNSTPGSGTVFEVRLPTSD